MVKMMALGAGAAMLLPVLASAAAAQSGNVEARVGRLESEMRAVQRKVFPGGDGQLVQPDIVAPTSPAEVPGAPASSPIADLTARVASLEQQMASLTGQAEQNGYQLRQLREQFEAYRAATDAKLAAPAPATVPAPAGAPATPAGGVGGDDEPAPIAPARASRPIAGRATAATAAAAPAMDAERAAKLAAIKRPAAGGDAAEEGYLYGYRLWQAGLYPEAQAQLKKVAADYPKNRRASFAQNLLGRAYLDDGKPSLASIAFYENYKKMPDGERAPDSLLYLGQALVKLNKPADACRVYDELSDVYGAKMGAAMKADVARGRTAAKCK